MSAACGRHDCPVPATPPATRLRTVVWPAGILLHRGHPTHRPDPTELVPSAGDTRFAPYPDVDHVYVGQTAFAALLESALHDAAAPEPALPPAVLGRWSGSRVALTAALRLIDLRDDQLERLGIGRHEVVATSATHYPCTRAWADPLRGRIIGGQPTHGLVWNSRQAELHAAAMGHRSALADLLDLHPTDVAVLWAPPTIAGPLRAVPGSLGRLDQGDGLADVRDLANLLEIAIH